MSYGHLQADCLYTGISSGPNARYRVWEAFTFTFLIVLASLDVYQFTCLYVTCFYATGGVLRAAEGQKVIVVRAADWGEAGHFCSGC